MALLTFAVLGFVVSISAYTVRLLDGSGLVWASSLSATLERQLRVDEDLQDFLLKVSIFFIGLSWPYLFVVCRQRVAVLQALASGYWKNYLHAFLHADVNLYILPPTDLICRDPAEFVALAKARLEIECEVEFIETSIPEAGRTALVAHIDGKPLPIAVDMCRNLHVLGDIISKEMSRPLGGTFCTVETKFEYLSKQFFATLESEWASYNNLSQSYFILDGISDPRLKRAIELSIEANLPPKKC
ncbi:hypothetical protein ACVDG2_12070 [Pseudosulfitobacter sp. RP-4]